MLDEKKILKSLILSSQLDGRPHPKEISIINSFSKKNRLDEYLGKYTNEIRDLSQERIKKDLYEEAKEISSKSNKYTFLCFISNIILADGSIDDIGHDILSSLENILDINFGYNNSKNIIFDESQEIIIKSNSYESIVVDAKAGTGKTEIIPAKVIELITKQYIDQGFIWIISFSRAAVAEMRARVVSKFGHYPKNLIIATIDSTTFKINRSFEVIDGFNDNRHIDHDISIKRLSAKFAEGDRGIMDLINNLKHLIIDESQDIVGDRRVLLERLIGGLNPNCGVTILGDRAQSIFGFTAKEHDDTRSLLELAVSNELTNRQWMYLELNKIYRSNNYKILETIESMRKKIIETPSERDQQKKLFYELKSPLKNGVNSDLIKKTELPSIMNENSMCISHDRASKLEFIRIAQKHKKNFRLKGTEYPEYILSWVSDLFKFLSDKNKENFDIHFFKMYYLQETTDDYKKKNSFWSIWNNLLLFGRDPNKAQSISIDVLRQNISRNTLSPPYEFASKTFGYSGTMIGNTHKLKGLEADDVIYKEFKISMKDISREERDVKKSKKNDLYEDNNKLCFVSSSRAKKKLYYLPESEIVINDWTHKNNKKLKRSYKISRLPMEYQLLTKQDRKQFIAINVELGQKHDYFFESIIIKQENNDIALKTQDFLHKLANININNRNMYKVFGKEEDRNSIKIYIKDIVNGDDYFIGEFNESLGKQLHEIFNTLVPNGYRYDGTRIKKMDLRIMDIGTFLLPNEIDPSVSLELEKFPDFKKTKTWLYPIIYGIGPVTFKKGIMDNIDRWVKN